VTETGPPGKDEPGDMWRASICRHPEREAKRTVPGVQAGEKHDESKRGEPEAYGYLREAPHDAGEERMTEESTPRRRPRGSMNPGEGSGPKPGYR
jgi:hypothetical protein